MKQYMLPHQAKQLALKLCSSPVYRFYVQFACNIRLYNLDVLRLSVAVFSQIGHFTKMQYMLSLPSHLFLCKPQIFYESSKYNFAIFIGPESDHCLPLSLTHWLTNSCLVNLIDVTLACENANSKLVNVVHVTGKDRFGNNLLQILKLRFC